MKMILHIAWRNLMRNKRRTILSAVTIAVGMMYFAMMDTMMTGMDKGAVDNMIELSTGAVKIQTRKYEADQQSLPLEHGISDRKEISELLMKDSRVKGITGRTIFLGQLSNYEDVYPVQGIVVERENDENVFSLKQYIEGEYFSEESRNEIILGADLAEDLNVGLGGLITLYSRTRFDTRNADEFVIVGLIKSTDPNINQNSVLITREAGEEFLELEGLITELVVSLNERNAFKTLVNDMVEIQTTLRNAFPEDTVMTFNETGADFMKMSESKSKFGYIFLMTILFIAAVGIFNTVLMSVYERVREIGVLRAHGMTPGTLTKMFMLEGFFTGIIGAVFGFILSLIVVYLFVEKGLPMDKMAGDMDVTGMPIWGTLYGVWNIPSIIAAALFSIVISTVAAVIPARKAGKMSVTDALRFN